MTGNHVLYDERPGVDLKRNGGGIYAYIWNDTDVSPIVGAANKPKWTITGSTVDNNDAYQNGGGIFVCAKYNGDFIATNTTISSNTTTHLTPNYEGDILGAGGGMFIAHYTSENESVDAYL